MTISTRFATVTRTGNWKNTLSQTQNTETETAIINFTFQISEVSKNTSKFSFSYGQLENGTTCSIIFFCKKSFDSFKSLLP